MNWDSLRLSSLTLPAKLLITLFLLVVGPGYLFGTLNIMFQHQNADLEPGLGVDDLRRTFHGMEKQVSADSEITVDSTMLQQVRPGGEMREYLEKGGEPAIRGLVTWLEEGAKEEDFGTSGLAESADPSAKSVIGAYCVECHNAAGGDMGDVPYAPAAEADPEYALVIEKAKAEFTRYEAGPQTLTLAPTELKKLVHITHAHILTIPVFTLIVGVLFLMTGVNERVKLILAPIPMLAVLLDIGSWWAARVFEPFIYLIAASGAIFGMAYALQILCILGSIWLGYPGEKDTSAG